MDENTPPATMVHNQDPKKLLGASPSIRNVLSPSNKVNVMTSNDNETIKKSMESMRELGQSPACSQQVLCRYAMSPEDADQWAERVRAITDNDHRDYIAFAAEVIHDILKSLSVFEDTIQADSDDDEIQFQPRTTLAEETTEPTQEQETAHSPAKHQPTDPTQTALSPSKFKDMENIFQIDDDSILSSMTKRLGSPCKDSPLKSMDNQGQESKPGSEDVDPFKSKTEIPNSPATTSTATMNELEEILDFDPFATKSAVMNSPVKNPQDALQEAVAGLGKGSEVEGRIEDELPDCLEDADTFSSKPDMSEGNITVIENLPEDASGLDYIEPPSNSEASADETQQAKTEDQPSDESSTDPFKTKSQIANTPEKKVVTEEAGYGLPGNLDDVDPFKTKSQVCNSPVQTAETDNATLPETLEDADPFKSKSQISNSPKQPAEIPKAEQSLPENLDDVDPFQPKSQIVNSPVKPETETTGLPESLDDVDPFKTKSQVCNSPLKTEETGNLPENLDELDPFKPKKQVMNSPVKLTDSPKKTEAVELPENLDDIDPFMPKKQMMNSPVKQSEPSNKTETFELPNNLDDIDPFKPKNQMMNSPIKSNDEQTETRKTIDLPENLDEIDPFKPKKQMMNSPSKPNNDENKETETTKAGDLPENLDDIDPFKPKKQMMNSPAKSDELKNTPKPDDLPDNLDDIDPFKPKKQMMNSPVKSNGEPKETLDVVDLPDNLDDMDPFKPKTQMMNSPVKSNNEPKETQDVVDSPDNLDDIDQFKPKKQMMNSPVKSNEIDTLELPGNLEDIDPFKPKKQMMNSPAKPESQQQVSNQHIPDNFDDMDPFKSKTQMKNSPAKTENVNKQNTQLSVDPFDNLDAFNPFQNMGKTNVTPSKNSNMDLLMGFGGTPKNMEGGIDLGNNLMCMIAPDKKAQEDNMAVSDADFRPANEVFSDPNVWDMLEKFGSSNNQKEESELARMSLYVKFDPLVDSSSSPANSKQQAASARCLQRMEVVRDGDESIMLMGTPPKPGGRRRSILVQRRPPTSVSSTIYEEDTDKKPTKPHIVDLMLCCEDEVPKVDQDQKPSADNLDEFSEVVEVLKYSETDMKRLLEKQKKQLTLEFQGRHLAMEQKYTTELRELKDTKSRNKDMMQVVSEYEKLINELITARETKDTESKEVISKLKSERDQAQNDLNVLENCFSDLLKRFEKAKGMLAGFKTNEEALKAFSQEQVAKLKTKDETIAKLKSQAETKLKQILEAKEKEKSSLSAEVLKLQSAQRRGELKIDGLEKDLEQKRKEVAELTDLCDALIAKVGGS